MEQQERFERVFKEIKREVSGRDVWTPERQERAEQLYRERTIRGQSHSQRSLSYSFVSRIFSLIGIKRA